MEVANGQPAERWRVGGAVREEGREMDGRDVDVIQY